MVIKMVTVRMSDFLKVHVCLIVFIFDVLSGKDIFNFFFLFCICQEIRKEKGTKVFLLCLLLQDGCVFTFRGIAGFCQRLFLKAKRDSYAEI